MNKVIMIGNLANDPESRTTQSGMAQCTFRIGVQRRFANQQGVRETDFFTVVCWRQLAENCARYLSKGRRAAVEGSLQTRSYEAQDGTRRYVTEIIADNVEFLSSREDSPVANGGAGETARETVPAREAKHKSPNASAFSPYEDDDLPF